MPANPPRPWLASHRGIAKTRAEVETSGRMGPKDRQGRRLRLPLSHLANRGSDWWIGASWVDQPLLLPSCLAAGQLKSPLLHSLSPHIPSSISPPHAVRTASGIKRTKRNSSMLRLTVLPAPGVFWQMSIAEWNRDVFCAGNSASADSADEMKEQKTDSTDSNQRTAPCHATSPYRGYTPMNKPPCRG